MVQWAVEVSGCVREPESGPVGRGGVWMREGARGWSSGSWRCVGARGWFSGSCGCVREPEGGPVGRGGVWVCSEPESGPVGRGGVWVREGARVWSSGPWRCVGA